MQRCNGSVVATTGGDGIQKTFIALLGVVA